VLRRDFGAQDAWVVRTPAGCRLDVRVDGRTVALLEDAEDAFWARFYLPVARERLHLGERRLEIEPWRLAPADLAAALRPYWEARVGFRGGGAGPRSG